MLAGARNRPRHGRASYGVGAAGLSVPADGQISRRSCVEASRGVDCPRFRRSLRSHFPSPDCPCPLARRHSTSAMRWIETRSRGGIRPRGSREMLDAPDRPRWNGGYRSAVRIAESPRGGESGGPNESGRIAPGGAGGHLRSLARQLTSQAYEGSSTSADVSRPTLADPVGSAPTAPVSSMRSGRGRPSPRSDPDAGQGERSRCAPPVVSRSWPCSRG